MDEASSRHSHEVHHQEGLASSFDQIDRWMRFAEAGEHSGHTRQEGHLGEVDLAHSLVAGSYGRELEDNPDAAVVELAHSEEDMHTVADHPDQPGPEVGHALHTTWVVVVRSDLEPLVQQAGRDSRLGRIEQKQEQRRPERRQGETGIAG